VVAVSLNNDLKTDGNPGVAKATEAAHAIDCRLAVPPGAGDFNDLHVEHGLEAVRESITVEHIVTETNEQAVARLADLDPITYDQAREAEAAALGVRVGTLDQEVKRARGAGSAWKATATIDAWPERVDGDALLDDLVTAFRKYIVAPTNALQTLALWSVHTYCFDRWQNTPRLYVSSPKRRSGKSRVLDVLDAIVVQPIRADGLSAPVVFRLTEDRAPTWLVDETDQWLDQRGELIGILNSGHAKGQKVYRCVGDEHRVQEFNVFAPVALAGIGKIKSDTLADRSISITIRRRLKTEPVKRFRRNAAMEEFDTLRQQILRWVQDWTDAAEPDIPATVDHDRMIDNFIPLLSIADAAGGDWPEIGREIMLAQYRAYDATEDGGWDLLLLQDIKDIFDELGQDRIFTKTLLDKLHTLTERPWPEFPNKRTGSTKPMTDQQLAYLLKPHEIKPMLFKIDGRPSRGYERIDFEETWSRYLSSPSDPPCQTVTPLPMAENRDFSGNTSAMVTVTAARPLPQKPQKSAGGNGVTVGTPPDGGMDVDPDDWSTYADTSDLEDALGPDLHNDDGRGARLHGDHIDLHHQGDGLTVDLDAEMPECLRRGKPSLAQTST
jgi:putative DNA primase/helicase